MVYVFLTDGFEEIEALSVIDLLRRGNVPVQSVSLMQTKMVTGSHGIEVGADIMFKDLEERSIEMLVLPGGPGTDNYFKQKELLSLLTRHYEKQGLLGAICAAPKVFAKLGFLVDKKATCYPSCEQDLAEGGAIVLQDAVVQDGTIVTSRGVGTALDFGIHLLTMFRGKEAAEQTKKLCVM